MPCPRQLLRTTMDAHGMHQCLAIDSSCQQQWMQAACDDASSMHRCLASGNACQQQWMQAVCTFRPPSAHFRPPSGPPSERCRLVSGRPPARPTGSILFLPQWLDATVSTSDASPYEGKRLSRLSAAPLVASNPLPAQHCTGTGKKHQHGQQQPACLSVPQLPPTNWASCCDSRLAV